MKWILLILMSFSTIFSWVLASDLIKAPSSFNFEKKLAVYVDFQNASSEILFDLTTKKVKVKSIIHFITEEDGFALFDLIPDILDATINNDKVHIKTITSPEGETKYRYIDKLLTKGAHKLVIENEITRNLQFKGDYINFAMWMSDLSDRGYIEQYLPSNMEFDQYTLHLKINIESDKNILPHQLYTNGKILSSNATSFIVHFPHYFTSSSFFLHLTKKHRFPSEQFSFNSSSGKKIPVQLYARSAWSLSGVHKKIENILNQLENDFGAWPHPNLTVYIAGLGGMEHAGATVTSEDALAHELTHSYFARGVMPKDGNAGWIDEAIASWRDNGFPKVKIPNFYSTEMASHSEYRRYTDKKAYKEGANFMAFLNFRLESKMNLDDSSDRSFIKFLKDFHGRYTQKSISTDLFKQELEIFSGENFTQEFNQYIYGNRLGHQGPQQNESGRTQINSVNPNHPHLTNKQLQQLL